MAESSYFFDGQAIYQDDWFKSIGNVLFDGIICGIDNDLFAYADASGMQVKVKSGGAHIKGVYYFSDAEIVLPIDPVINSGNSRYDRIVIEVDRTNKTSTCKIVKGTESASPVTPTLTKSSTIQQLGIGLVLVEYGVSNIANTKITPAKSWALGTFTVPQIIGTGQSVITTGVQPVGVIIPVRSKIIKWELLSDVSGSIQIDLWRGTNYSTFPPTVGNTICSNKPRLTSTRRNRMYVWDENSYKNSISDYFPTISFDKPNDQDHDGYVLLANVDSASTLKMVNLQLTFARMASP
jgi:hypothetical protein